MKLDPAFARQMGVYAVALTTLIAYLGVCIGGGWFLIRHFGWPDWVLVFPALFGMTAAFVQIYRYLRWADEKGKQSSESKSPPGGS